MVVLIIGIAQCYIRIFCRDMSIYPFVTDGVDAQPLSCQFVREDFAEVRG